MSLSTPTSPHTHNPESVTRVMLRVIYAMIPGIIAYVWFFGWGVVINICLAVTVALISETMILWLRKYPVRIHLTDCSAVVTAVLLAMAIPPLAPWWVTLIGVAFAIIVAKHLYGGLGYNPFNPAMIGYVMLLISFPKEMTIWLPPISTSEVHLGFTDTLTYIFTHQLPAGITFDALTEATPLDSLKTHIDLGNTVAEIREQFGFNSQVTEILSVSPIFGRLGGLGWEWIGGAFLFGGLWLMYKKVINWHIPGAMIASLTVMALLFTLINPDLYAGPLFHLFSGATMLGAFFIATDPVTASTTPQGRLVYGAGIGILTYVIRTWGGYPDAVAFAVLLMNMTVPVIDYYFKPRVFGHKE